MSRILIVDDEVEIKDVLEQFLLKNGFEVVAVTGGQKAIEIIKSDLKIDLMITDIKMPGKTGLDVLAEMKGLNVSIPVIVLTGSIDAEKYNNQLEKTGHNKDNVVTKPIDLNIILDKIKDKLR